MALQPYQQRVMDEKAELDEKRQRLDAWFDSDAFGELDQVEQDLLLEQADIMDEYAAVLKKRIDLF